MPLLEMTAVIAAVLLLSMTVMAVGSCHLLGMLPQLRYSSIAEKELPGHS